MFSKKGLVGMRVAFLLVSIVFIIIFIFLFNTHSSSAEYESSIQECSLVFSLSDSRNAAFFKGGEFSASFLDLVSISCPMKTVAIDARSSMAVPELLADCHRKTPSTSEFFTENMEGRGFCMVCGSLKANEQVDDFGSRLRTQLSEEEYRGIFENGTNAITFNPHTLLEEKYVPSSLSADEELYLVFSAFKPAYSCELSNLGDCYEITKQSIANLLGSTSVLAGFVIDTLSESSRPTYSGMFFVKRSELEKEYEFDSEREFSYKDVGGMPVKCDVLIKPKVFEG